MIEYHEFTAMSTQVVLAADVEPGAWGAERAREGFHQAQALVEQYEARLSRFRETSELSALNHAAGTWFNASPELFELLREAYRLYEATGGLFNPGVLNALERAGYDGSIELVRARSAWSPVPVLPDPADFAATAFDERLRAIWLAPGTRVDLGGIAKGWIAQRAAERLAEYARACAVSAGGDLYAIGTPEGEPGWPVALEDPLDPAKALTSLCLPGGAVATSSVTRRRWKQGDMERHHLIDPRTGEPAETRWLSVTAITQDAAVAEVMAKALLLAGPDDAPALAEREQVEMMAVDRAGRLWATAGAGALQCKN